MRAFLQLLGAVTFVYILIVFVYDGIFFQSLMNNHLQDDIKGLKAQCVLEGVAFPEIAAAQIIHETNWLSSDVYKEHNNCFGMTCHKWGTYCICEGNNRKDKDGMYCDYESTLFSIKDYAEWQQQRFRGYRKAKKPIPITREEYLQFLIDVHYATDKRYIHKVEKYLDYTLTVH